MKKFNIDWLARQQPPSGVVRPAPFPGKYPTRIAVRARWTTREGEERGYDYLGKPIRMVHELMDALARLPIRAEITFWEFDRKQVIHVTTFSRVPQSRITSLLAEGMDSVNGNLRRFYHPWAERHTPIMFAVQQRIKRIRWGGKIWRVYAPESIGDRLSKTQHLIPHKQWLDVTFSGVMREQTQRTIR